MKEEITLPSGATVVLRDPATLRYKDRKSIFRNVKDGDSQLMSSFAMVEGILASLVEEWSFDLLPPGIKLDSLGELEMADMDMLTVKATEAMKVLFPSVGKTDESEADPESPTDASNV